MKDEVSKDIIHRDAQASDAKAETEAMVAITETLMALPKSGQRRTLDWLYSSFSSYWGGIPTGTSGRG